MAEQIPWRALQLPESTPKNAIEAIVLAFNMAPNLSATLRRKIPGSSWVIDIKTEEINEDGPE